MRSSDVASEHAGNNSTEADRRASQRVVAVDGRFLLDGGPHFEPPTSWLARVTVRLADLCLRAEEVAERRELGSAGRRAMMSGRAFSGEGVVWLPDRTGWTLLLSVRLRKWLMTSDCAA